MDVLKKRIDSLDVAFVTANIGSIFEKPEQLLDNWVTCFVETLFATDGGPKFVALHCQEIGGKSFGSSMAQVDAFFRRLIKEFEERSFNISHAFIDKAVADDVHKFTALASIYFIHSDVCDKMEIWNFATKRFDPMSASHIHDEEDLDLVPTVHKHKFGSEMTPLHRPSRKGFLRTRWRICDEGVSDSFELLNVHLFHDESNFVAMQKFPSMYSESRRRALEFTIANIGNNTRESIQETSDDIKIQVACFIFGDFNFRLDVGAVVSWLSEGAELHETMDDTGTLTRQVFCEKAPGSESPETEVAPGDREVLALGKKLFNLRESESRNILQCDLTRKKLLSHDKELQFFNDLLMESPISFAPSYPYSEDSSHGTLFSGTRCPSWCDRVFYDKSAESISSVLSYDLIGKDTCMGDHKPVMLRLLIGGRQRLKPSVTTNGTPESVIGKRNSRKPTTDPSATLNQQGDDRGERASRRKKIAATKCCPKPKRCVLL